MSSTDPLRRLIDHMGGPVPCAICHEPFPTSQLREVVVPGAIIFDGTVVVDTIEWVCPEVSRMMSDAEFRPLAVRALKAFVRLDPVDLEVVGQGGMEPRCRFCRGDDWPLKGKEREAAMAEGRMGAGSSRGDHPEFHHTRGCPYVLARQLLADARG